MTQESHVMWSELLTLAALTAASQSETHSRVYAWIDVTKLDAALQLACSRLPVASLTILEPWAKLAFCGDGLVEYTGYSPGVVGRTVRAPSPPLDASCKHKNRIQT